MFRKIAQNSFDSPKRSGKIGGIVSNPYVLITGASSGIGAGFARALAQRGVSLILVSRREERLNALRNEFKDVDIVPMPFDLYQIGAAELLFAKCREKGLEVKGLINNAGLGWQAALHELSQEQVDRMLTVNLIVLTHLCRLFLPPMIERRSGFILNIASTAGFQPVPYFSVYAATKSYVINLSEALYDEVKDRGVLVSCLCPGPVDTEFQEKANLDPRFFAHAQSVEEVVKAGLKALEKERPLAWTSTFQRMFCLGSELFPRVARRGITSWLMKSAGIKSGA
ncbi:MAG: SDR family oxidoreductase [bacterium]